MTSVYRYGHRWSSSRTKHSARQDGDPCCRHSSRKKRALPTTALNLSDVHHEISAVYGPECICKAQVYSGATKFTTGITDLHDADLAHEVVTPANMQNVYVCVFSYWNSSAGTDVAQKRGKAREPFWKTRVLFFVYEIKDFVEFTFSNFHLIHSGTNMTSTQLLSQFPVT